MARVGRLRHPSGVRAILFDLDDTLLDSSELAQLRTERRWDLVASSLHRVRSFEGDPHRLPERCRAQGLAVGVVTSSPRFYAEALLERFGIRADVLVTGSDDYAPKPDPASLIAALSELGVAAEEAWYVGNDVGDFQAAATGHLISIGAMWAFAEDKYPRHWARHWPDVGIRNVALFDHLDELPSLGLAAEVALASQPIRLHFGSVISVEPRTLALGRYFTTSDPRCSDHSLSQAVLDNKDTHRDAAAIGEAFETVAKRFESLEGALVTGVPRSQGFDRLSPHRDAVVRAVGGTNHPDLLRQTRTPSRYKGLHGRDARDEANKGRFVATVALHGETVVLVDDVYTTGSTVASCRDALFEAGAGAVQVLTLSLSQEPLPEHCPRCGEGILQLKRNRKTGEPFWACSRWCGYTRSA
jgi:HAD superfamily hydrolase (TIGR01549 family)